MTDEQMAWDFVKAQLSGKSVFEAMDLYYNTLNLVRDIRHAQREYSDLPLDQAVRLYYDVMNAGHKSLRDDELDDDEVIDTAEEHTDT